jgi:hypothetical protein
MRHHGGAQTPRPINLRHLPDKFEVQRSDPTRHNWLSTPLGYMWDIGFAAESRCIICSIIICIMSIRVSIVS